MCSVSLPESLSERRSDRYVPIRENRVGIRFTFSPGVWLKNVIFHARNREFQRDKSRVSTGKRHVRVKRLGRLDTRFLKENFLRISPLPLPCVRMITFNTLGPPTLAKFGSEKQIRLRYRTLLASSPFPSGITCEYNAVA
jgi:hypothetical protein